MTASSVSGEELELNYDEVSRQRSLLFSNSLKDLKNLRTQLYSAAEYFELSYTNDDQKQIVAETLRDYTIKALVNTVDHLGSVTFKVNNFLDERVDEVSGTKFRVSCVEQRIRTCQDYIDYEGLSQQSLVIHSPKYHKRYLLPGGESTQDATRTSSNNQGRRLAENDGWHRSKNAVQATIRETSTSSVRETPRSSFRKGRSDSPPPRNFQRSATFTANTTKKVSEKRTVSPCRFPLLHTGLVSSRPASPTMNRPTTPSSADVTQQYFSKPRKSASIRVQAGKENSKDTEQIPSKSKRLFKALLSRRKSKKDDMLYTYLDEY